MRRERSPPPTFGRPIARWRNFGFLQTVTSGSPNRAESIFLGSKELNPIAFGLPLARECLRLPSIMAPGASSRGIATLARALILGLNPFQPSIDDSQFFPNTPGESLHV